MKILMLYPKYPDHTFWNVDREIKLVYQKEALLPPLGLLTLAAYLPEAFQVRLVDRNISAETPSDWEWADVVFISAMLTQRDDYRTCVQNAKRHETPIAVGGPLTNSMPEQVIKDADWVCFGEVENVVERFVEDLCGDFRGKVYQGSDADMRRVKAPRFDLIDVAQYSHMVIQFSRGCPYNCEFCDIIEIYGRRPRTKTPSQLLGELSLLKRLGHRGAVFVVDDNFIGDRKRASELLGELAVWNSENGRPFFYYTEVSLNIANYPDLLARMSAANFRNVFIGIETPDPKLLQMTQKTHNLFGGKDPLEKLRGIREHGIHVMAGLIVGFDGEGPEIFEVQREFIQGSGIGIAMMGLLQALPNTQLHRRLEREGRLLDAVRVSANITTDGLNYIPTGQLTRRQYLESYVQLLKDVFAPRAFFERTLVAALELKRNSKRDKIREATRRAPVLVARKIVSAVSPYAYRLGIKGVVKGSRALFWRNLFTVLRKNPSALDAFLLDCFYFMHLNPHVEYVEREIHRYLEEDRPADELDTVMPEEATAAIVDRQDVPIAAAVGGEG